MQYTIYCEWGSNTPIQEKLTSTCWQELGESLGDMLHVQSRLAAYRVDGFDSIIKAMQKRKVVAIDTK